MLYITDNLINYLINLFRVENKFSKECILENIFNSIGNPFSCFDLYMGKDSMIVYFIYSIVSMCLLLSAEIWEMILITVGLICFTGAIDGM